MLVLIRALVMIALAVVTVAPHHAYAAPAAAHHAVAADHGHDHGAGQPEDLGHDHSGLSACCASLSVQCGGAALALGNHWTPAERRFAWSRKPHERGARTAGAPPEFEPPPPRS